MGCSSSRQTEGSSPSGKPEDNACNEPDHMTPEEAANWLSKEVGISKERSEKMVQSLPRDGDHVKTKDLKSLSGEMKQLLSDLDSKFKENKVESQGRLKFDDALQAVKKVFPSMPEISVKMMLRNRDENSDELIDIKEFVEFYASVLIKKEKIKDIFKSLDVDGSGALDKEEVYETLMSELCLFEMEARTLVDDFDTDKNGKINLNEFLNMWTQLFG